MLKLLVRMLLLLASVLVSGWLLSIPLQNSQWKSCSDLQQYLAAQGPYTPWLIYLSFVASSIAPVPATLVAMLTGVLYGPLWGSLLSLAGATSGATLTFFLSRSIARQAVQRVLAGQNWYQQMQGMLTGNGLGFVIFVRLVPLFPFTGLNFACGILPIKIFDYILGSLLGMLPATFVFVSMGRMGCQAFDQIYQKHLGLMQLPLVMRWQLGSIFVLLAILSCLPFFWQLHQRRKNRDRL